VTSKTKLLALIAEAEELGLSAPTDVILELARKQAQSIADSLRVNISDLPTFTLTQRGLVPAPARDDLVLFSNGWREFPNISVPMAFGGGAKVTYPITPDLGGTGIANLAASTLTLGAATSITGGGTLALGGFVATVPATGTLALRSDKLSAFAATTSAELAGVLSDESGTGLAVFNTRPTLTNDAQTCQLLTDAASVAWDTDLGTVAYVKVAGNRTIANPTNFRAGGQYTLYIQQDLTGGRVVTWGTAFLWDNNKVPVINTTPFAMSVFGFFSDGTYLFGTSNTPMRKGLADSVVYLGDVVTHSGEILWN
jgi:hypothetical protein